MCGICPAPNSFPVLPRQLGVQQVSSILILSRVGLRFDRFEGSEPQDFRSQLQMGCPGCTHFCLADYKFRGSHDPLLMFDNLLDAEETATQTETRTDFLFQDLLGYWEMLKNCPLMMTSLMFTPLPLGSAMSHTLIGYE